MLRQLPRNLHLTLTVSCDVDKQGNCQQGIINPLLHLSVLYYYVYLYCTSTFYKGTDLTFYTKSGVYHRPY